GVVEEAIDAPVCLDSRLHVSFHVGDLGDIGRHRDGVPVILTDDTDCRLGPGAVAVYHHHLRALPRERHGRRAADAVTAAGDQCNLASEIHFALRPMTRVHYHRHAPLSQRGPGRTGGLLMMLWTGPVSARAGRSVLAMCRPASRNRSYPKHCEAFN